MPDKQGQRAFYNGLELERMTEHMLEKIGFQSIDYKTWKENPDQYKGNVLIRNYPYRKVTGGNGRMEFLLKSDELLYRTRVECRSQRVSGSVEEKLFWLYDNSTSDWHEDNTIIILEGNGFAPKTVEWFKAKCRQTPTGKSVRVFSLDEFVRWAEHKFTPTLQQVAQ